MSTYLKEIEAEYDTWCDTLGREITSLVNAHNPVKIEPFTMGDCIHHSINFVDTKFDIHTGNLCVVFNDVDNTFLNITIWTPNSNMIQPFTITATTETRIAYENMMLGSHLWHAYQSFMATDTPNLDANYKPDEERPH